MSNPLIVRYKIPFLISLIVGLAIIILSDETKWYFAVLTFVGAILGFLLIDLEYIVHAYLVDPSSDVSMHIKEYFSRGNIVGLVDFFNTNEFNFGELSIRSMMFQVILTFLALIAVTNMSWAFGRGVVLSMSINLLYFQFHEYLKTHTLQRWFWIYKGNLSTGFYKAYMVVLLIILAYQFVLL